MVVNMVTGNFSIIWWDYSHYFSMGWKKNHSCNFTLLRSTISLCEHAPALCHNVVRGPPHPVQIPCGVGEDLLCWQHNFVNAWRSCVQVTIMKLNSHIPEGWLWSNLRNTFGTKTCVFPLSHAQNRYSITHRRCQRVGKDRSYWGGKLN